jgi:hypothetical protein
MKKYIGIKEVLAKPMTRQEYNDYRGWDLLEDEDGSDRGFLVEYIDGGQSNHPNHDGYVSWSPDDVFNSAYRPVDGMTFGLAIEAMKKGHKVCRDGWNGKGMFVVYMSPLYLPPYSTADTSRKVNDRTAKWVGENTPLDSQGYFAMFTAKKQWQPGWLASQADMLAEDWMVV